MPRTPEQNRPYMQAYYAENRETLLPKQREYQRARLLGPDGDHVRSLRRARVQAMRHRNPELARQYCRDSRTRIRSELIAAYGGRCVCCGETAAAFLTLDHTNHDGKEHRAAFGGRGIATSFQVYSDLKRRGWPTDGFRLLCMNCNFATRFGAACPHDELFASLETAARSCV